MCVFSKKNGDFQVYFLEGFSQFQKKNGLHLIFSQPKRIRLPGTYSPLLWVARRNFLYRALCSLWVKETDSALVHYYDPHGEGERLLFIIYIYILFVTVPRVSRSSDLQKSLYVCNSEFPYIHMQDEGKRFIRVTNIQCSGAFMIFSYQIESTAIFLVTTY